MRCLPTQEISLAQIRRPQFHFATNTTTRKTDAMSSSSGPSQSLGASTGSQSPYQNQLVSYSRNNGLPEPTFQVVSDRRGGRTAWSSFVNIQGQRHQARFWYDGPYINNAKEDAAQVALQRLGQLPDQVPNQNQGGQARADSPQQQQQQQQQYRQNQNQYQQQQQHPQTHQNRQYHGRV